MSCVCMTPEVYFPYVLPGHHTINGFLSFASSILAAHSSCCFSLAAGADGWGGESRHLGGFGGSSLAYMYVRTNNTEVYRNVCPSAYLSVLCPSLCTCPWFSL